MESAYIHIPFCKNICSYCDFCKVLYHGPWITQYLNALLLEINNRYDNDKLKTLYIGGGTPSSLVIKDLKYLFQIIKKMDLSELEEFTFECNLNDINEELLNVLKETPMLILKWEQMNIMDILKEHFNKLDFEL